MNLSSLRSRVTTWYVGLLATALLVFGATLYFGVQGYLRTELQHSLSGEAHAIASNFLAFEEEKGVPWMTGEINEAYAPEHSGRFIRITRTGPPAGAKDGKDGTVLYESGDTRDPYIDAEKISHPHLANPGDSLDQESFHQETQPGSHRLLIFTLPYTSASGTHYIIQMGASLSPIERLLYSLLRVLFIITPFILIAAAFGGHFLMNRPLRPLVAITQQAERIGTHELGERLPVISTGDEMERLSLSLNRMISRLEDALNHNRRFSADVSHELRTPLTILRGELEQLIQSPTLPLATAETIGSALEEIDRMAKIVENLLAIARLDSGTDVMNLQCVDLTKLTQWTVGQMHLLAEEKNITITCVTTCVTTSATTSATSGPTTSTSPTSAASSPKPPTAPPFAPIDPILILADPARVKQVLVNILDNAIKYTPPNGRIDVSVSTSPEAVQRSETIPRMAILEVRDTGIGIPPQSLPNVFERFYRSDKARSRESGGAGLGLSIVQAICNAHGGAVTIQSTEGSGTTVRVELPLDPNPTPQTRQELVAELSS
jgi:two-component system, OmpR family, sensor kinase